MPGNTVWGVVGTTTHRRKEMCSVQATFVSHSVTVGGPVAIRGHGWGAMGRAYGASSATRRPIARLPSHDDCALTPGSVEDCALTPGSVEPGNTMRGIVAAIGATPEGVAPRYAGLPATVSTDARRRGARQHCMRRSVCGGQATVAGRSVGTTTHRRTDARRGVERRHGGGTTGRGEAMDASVSASRWTTSRIVHRQDASRH